MSATNLSNMVPATLQYFTPPADGSTPFTDLTVDEATGKPKRNWESDPRIVGVEDVRGKENQFLLDLNGFQFVHCPSRHTAFVDDRAIASEYYPEAVELVKTITGGSDAIVFDHTIRRRTNDSSGTKVRQPVAQVHVDQTPKAAATRVRVVFPPAEAEALLARRRFQIINVWRPIGNPALDWPLALCDARTVDQERDLVAVKMRLPGRDGETYAVKHAPEHRWFYLRGMTPEECVVFKCFDSKADGSVATHTPHTGFEDSMTPQDAPFRESIELRLFVFFD